VGSATPEAGTDEKTLLKRLVSKINALKLRYLLQYSQAQEGSDAEIVAFIAECLNVYSLMAEKEDGPSDDACILAVSVLIKLGSTTSSIYNLQAACLAQLLRDNSQYNFNATLLQLLNARILGLGSIAIAAFHDLNLREVQYDTLGHLLYTRIITLHPFAVSLKDVRALEDRYKNPKSSIIFATQFPRRATDATLDTLTKDLENVFFDKLHEFITFNERVSRSYSSMQSRLELQRMKRLTDDDSISMSSYIPKSYVFKSHDNRDFGVLVDFETAKASANFRTIATGGYKPKVSFLLPA
jgi:N-terminal acetyltransferase B complex non-catalytic subunit